MENENQADQPEQTNGDSQDGGESLDALAQEAQTLDAKPEQDQQAEKQASNVQLIEDNTGELMAAMMMAREMAIPILPTRQGEKLLIVWDDSVLLKTAKAGAAVLALHGQKMGDMLGKYAPYLMLVAALAGPLRKTHEILTTPDPKPVHTENTSNVFPING